MDLRTGPILTMDRERTAVLSRLLAAHPAPSSTKLCAQSRPIEWPHRDRRRSEPMRVWAPPPAGTSGTTKIGACTSAVRFEAWERRSEHVLASPGLSGRVGTSHR